MFGKETLDELSKIKRIDRKLAFYQSDRIGARKVRADAATEDSPLLENQLRTESPALFGPKLNTGTEWRFRRGAFSKSSRMPLSAVGSSGIRRFPRLLTLDAVFVIDPDVADTIFVTIICLSVGPPPAAIMKVICSESSDAGY